MGRYQAAISGDVLAVISVQVFCDKNPRLRLLNGH